MLYRIAIGCTHGLKGSGGAARRANRSGLADRDHRSASRDRRPLSAQ